jgi:hypothetical protein
MERIECAVPGVEIQFEKGMIQRLLDDGVFRIQGADDTNVVTLSRLDTDQTTQVPGISGGVYPPKVPDPVAMWRIDLLPGAKLEMHYVTVKYSDARLHPIAKPDDVTLFYGGTEPNTYPTNFKWIESILAVYSFTEDSDGNGRIDRIRVTAETTLNFVFSNDPKEFLVEIKDGATRSTRARAPTASRRRWMLCRFRPTRAPNSTSG